MTDSDEPTPRVFISYSWDSELHRVRALRLTELLRHEYSVAVQIDRYFETPPPTSWPAWMHDQLELADFVVLICSKTYNERLLGRSTGDTGRGARWEGAILTQEVYNQDISRLIPVVFGEENRQHVPYFLQGTTCYNVDVDTGLGLDPLARRIWNEPEIEPVPLGARPRFSRRHSDVPQPESRLRPKTIAPAAIVRLEEAVTNALQAGPAATSKGKDSEIGLFKLRSSINSFAEAISSLIGHDCRATIFGLHVEPDDGEPLNPEFVVQRIVSNSSSAIGRGKGFTRFNLGDSSEFSRMFVDNLQPLILNDLDDTLAYKNSHFEAFPTYRATALWPIAKSSGDDSDSRTVIGFLAIDSPEAGAFDEEGVLPIGSIYASVLFASLSAKALGNDGPRERGR